MLFFERKKGGEYAVVVDVRGLENVPMPDFDEFCLLVKAAGVTIVEEFNTQRKSPVPATFIGKGKLEELEAMVKGSGIDVVLFNQALSPGQERNLEKILECRVVDRTGVILDIFAQRARTHEGKLQVELAQLTHLSTRLVRGWTHLERQKGGIGLRGPGETQLESDRRMLRDRIKVLRKRLEKVSAQRQQNRQSRMKQEVPIISLVGYTNAGKSSLFNSVTNAEVMAKDMLFATLDPTYRRWQVSEIGDVVLIDTVGFVRHLPHKLVDAFSATLEESIYADLLIHVIDASHEDRVMLMQAVDEVLQNIGAEKIPMLQVFNKIDLTGEEPRIDYDENGVPVRVWLSVQENLGLDCLEKAIIQRIGDATIQGCLTLSPQKAALRSKLYELGVVMEENISDVGEYLLQLRISPAMLEKLLKQYETDVTTCWQEVNRS